MADMDGNNIEVLVGEGITLPNNIEIDPYFRKICFIDGGKSLFAITMKSI